MTDKKFKYCPFCSSTDTLSMTKKHTTSIKENKVIKGIFDVWVCSNCGNEFFNNWTLKKSMSKPNKL